MTRNHTKVDFEYIYIYIRGHWSIYFSTFPFSLLLQTKVSTSSNLFLFHQFPKKFLPEKFIFSTHIYIYNVKINEGEKFYSVSSNTLINHLLFVMGIILRCSRLIYSFIFNLVFLGCIWFDMNPVISFTNKPRPDFPWSNQFFLPPPQKSKSHMQT